MKILLLNQFFWPDSAATSQLLTDLARGLADQGHTVYAIAADGGYAAAGDASLNPPAVEIHRVRSLPFVRGKAGRVLSYLSFYLSAAVRGLTLPRPDLVLTLTTPPLLSLLGTLIRTLRGSRHFIWEMDVYPDVAIDLNYFKAGGVADRVTGWLADLSRRRADGIIALGECMKQRLVNRGIDPRRIAVADNWADGSAIHPLPRPGDPDQLVLLYSGNLGLAHDLDTLTESMRQLRLDPRFRFLFVGSGGRRQQLAQFCETHHLTSVELRPYVQRESLEQSLAAGDIGLVTQREACCGSVVPSKVYGLMAAGRPILFIGPKEATPARIVERFQCGWHINCNDSAALTSLLQHLALNPAEMVLAGQRARRALLENYDLPLGVARILHILNADHAPLATLEHLETNFSSDRPRNAPARP
ncbi:MAG: glycosyltransferase family 4 protein [Acidobacteriaceae bacterium]